jgi:hypothetical protein
MAISGLADVLYQTSHPAESWNGAVEALDLWKRFRSRFTPRQATQTLVECGMLLSYIQPSNPIHREYLEQAVRIGREYPKEVDSVLRSTALQLLAESYLSAPGNPQENYRQASPLIQEALTLDRADPTHGEQLVTSLQTWGRINRFLGNYGADEAAQREAYELVSKLLGPDHGRTAGLRAIWAVSLAGTGNFEEAYVQSQAALASMRHLYPTPGSFQLWTNTAAAAYAACGVRRFQECETLAREASQTLGPHPESTDLRVYEAKSYLGIALAGQNRDAEAMPLLRETEQFYNSRGRKGVFRALLEDAYRKAESASGGSSPQSAK